MHSKQRTVINDERELCVTKDKSESDSNDCVNPSDFGFAKNRQILTTLKFGFKL